MFFLINSIYVGNDIVIHFTRRGQEVGTGTILDLILISSRPARSQVHYFTCTPSEEGHGVVSSCMNCFLASGILYRFKYTVSPTHFIAKARGGIYSATKEFLQALRKERDDAGSLLVFDEVQCELG